MLKNKSLLLLSIIIIIILIIIGYLTYKQSKPTKTSEYFYTEPGIYLKENDANIGLMQPQKYVDLPKVKSKHSKASIEAVARKYAPMAIFHKDEKYFASPVEWHMNYVTPYYAEDEDDNNTKKVFLMTKENIQNDQEKILDFFQGISPVSSTHPKGIEQKVVAYCFVILLPDGKVNLAYYFFFPYNYGKNECVGIKIKPEDPCLGKQYRFGNHVGDIEGCIVYLDTDLNPYKLYFGAHQFDFDLDWNSNQFIKVNDNGVVDIDNSKNTHPVVYLAYGSHGTWISGGDHDYTPQTDALKIAGAVANLKLVDVTSTFADGIPWMTWKNLRILFPEEWSGVKEVTSPEFSKYGIKNWTTQVGRWGTINGNEDPIEKLFGYRRLESGPGGFVDKNGRNIHWRDSILYTND